ncbi:FAD-dependent oxidoreductase [Nocardioides sp. GXQ0305]|uniref:FAD-dependent oxidoreductase n=1 Tax=Nocardioides sp. GXQ0305 TaxID=3423912 RepID=UPI003D7D6F69
MKALVVGGGVAGPAVALGLQRVGVDAVVLEARTEAQLRAGSYLTLSPNGVHAADQLGVAAELRAAAFPTRRNDLVSGTGRALGSVPLGSPLSDGTTGLTLKRPALAELLATAASARGTEVRYGARVVAVHDGTDRVEVELDDGSRVGGDLLVAADGVRSRVRSLVDPSAPEGRYVGLTNFGGITRDTPRAEELPREAWQMVFGARAFFGAHRTPEGDVVWFANVPRPAIGADERAATSDEQWQGWLADLLADDAGPAAELVRTGRLELAGDSTYDLGHVPVWHRGRVVLVGDAAHAPAPSSGQGASMALEDAVELARCLRDVPSGVEDAFAAYEALRRERVERIVEAGARSSSSKVPGRVGRVVRDAMLRLVFRYVVTDRSVAWMSDHRVSLDSPVPAPTGRG